MIVVAIAGVLTLSALLCWSFLDLYGLRPKFAAGSVDAQGRAGPAGLEAINWAELVRIEIVTTDQGPFIDDLFWLFVARDGSFCSLPGGMVNGDVFERISALGELNHEAIFQAMGSCEDARFLVWRASSDRNSGLPRAA